MKREAAALGLLLLLIAGAWLSARQTDALAAQVCACLERSENALERGETGEALAALERGLEAWAEGERRLARILDRQDTEAVRGDFTALAGQLRRGETELAADYARLRWHLEELCARQRLSLETLLISPSGAWSALP